MTDPESRPTVYIETTIVSYLTARPSRDAMVRRHQDLTRRWWNEDRFLYQPIVSPAVLQEAEQGDAEASRRRLDVVRELTLLERLKAVEELALSIRRDLRLPDKARVDALHLAYAVHYEADYLLTWNCRHLAEPSVMRRLADVTRQRDLWLPIIYTPVEMFRYSPGPGDMR